MLNILDLFPHGPSTTVPEQLRLGCVSAVASTLFVNLPLKYALQYGLNTLEREQQAEQTILDRSPSLLPGSVPPFPSVWVFGRSQQALLDLLSADTHLHSRLGENTDGHHPWNHFERNSSEFRPDLWARMAFHYCPTLLHLEAFFVCIHLNQTLIQQQQRNKQQGQHEKEGLPLVIILAGFFNLDAVNKDLSPTSSSSAAPYPPPTHISGLTETDASAAASDGSPYRAHLKLVSLVMSEIKDAIQWIEKSLHRHVRLIIVEELREGSTANATGNHQEDQLQHSSKMAPQHTQPPYTISIHSSSSHLTEGQGFLEAALGFWTDATAIVHSIDLNDHPTENSLQKSVAVSPSKIYRLLLRTKHNRRRLFRTTTQQYSTLANGAATATLLDPTRQESPNLNDYRHLPPSDLLSLFTRESSSMNGGCPCKSKPRQLLSISKASSLSNYAIALEWAYCAHGNIIKALAVQE